MASYPEANPEKEKSEGAFFQTAFVMACYTNEELCSQLPT
jgi:hypothetical protein